MLISTRGRYALRVMVDLAEHQTGGYTAMKEVAARQEISLKYLERILPALAKNGMIEGVTGKGGGYRLCRRPEEYNIGEILELMEGSLSSVACLAGGDNACPRRTICPTLPMWKEYDQMVHDFFFGKSLKDLMSQPQSV